MADEFHLEEGLIDGHRLGRMLLLPNDPTGSGLEVRIVDHVDGRLDDHCAARRRRGEGRGSAPAMVHAPPVGGLTEPAFELLRGDVERFVEVLGAGLAAHYRPPGAAGDLDMLAAAVLPTIAFVMQLDVCADDLLVISLDLAELVRYVK